MLWASLVPFIAWLSALGHRGVANHARRRAGILTDPASASTASKQEVNRMVCFCLTLFCKPCDSTNHMAGSRKWRGALVFALWWASVACFAPLRAVKLRSLPPRVGVGEANIFWAAVQKAAGSNETDVQTYMKSSVALARSHMDSGQVVDRDAAIQTMMESMDLPGLLTLVLGGKNLGKSFLRKTALQRSSANLVALSVDMRSMPGTNLLDSILKSAHQTLEKVADERDTSQYFGPLSGIVAALTSAFENMGPAASPVAGLVRSVVETATKKDMVRSAIDTFLARVKAASKRTAIVVDEANLALPGLSNGERERSEAKEALAAITQWTKQVSLQPGSGRFRHEGHWPDHCHR